MDDDTLMMRLTNMLIEQQALPATPSPQHRICGDLGVCGGDFQDFMTAVWTEFDLGDARPITLDVPERAITLDDVATFVRAQEHSAH